jgi:hypothetical protein
MVPSYFTSVKGIDSPETLVRVWSLKATAVNRKNSKIKVKTNPFLNILLPSSSLLFITKKGNQSYQLFLSFYHLFFKKIDIRL